MTDLQNRRIMIVEDNVTNMAVYAVALRRSGAVVLQDPFNSDTVNLIKRNLPVDIILLDLMLRNSLDGYSVYEELQDDPELAGIPVVAVSAADPATEIPRAKERGFAGFISKPIDPFRLIEQLVTCINGESVWYSHEESLRGF